MIVDFRFDFLDQSWVAIEMLILKAKIIFKMWLCNLKHIYLIYIKKPMQIISRLVHNNPLHNYLL